MDGQEEYSSKKHTVIISDLHLCEAEPVHPKYPLWKKYKTREFFFDDDYVDFLKHIKSVSDGPMELVLNGDIFDFDSVSTFPQSPPYRISTLERLTGLHPQEEKSLYKIRRILRDHTTWVQATRDFVLEGHSLVFIVGNHDLELHWPAVQQASLTALDLPDVFKSSVRFCEWFYISEKDTYIEHGNQQDPYCLCQDPIHPFIQRFNKLEVRVPFGNLATRYLVNGMGFFNPHLAANYIMSAFEYVRFFIKYMLRAQPQLMITWLWRSTAVLFQTAADRLRPAIKEPLTIEDRIEAVARKSNATPRMVRELKELFALPASSQPWIIAKELWLDRALIMALAFFILIQLWLVLDQVFDFSIGWLLIPFFLFLPFFVFYSRSVFPQADEFKEPRETIMRAVSMITKTNRIIYGHTHIVRHEMIGPVEHLNSGTWSPAFEDVECTRPVGQKTFIWIAPRANRPGRKARVYQFKDGQGLPVFNYGGEKIRTPKKAQPLEVE